MLWAARKLGRPVKWISERSEAFLADYHAPRQCLATWRSRSTSTASFLALRVSTLANLGAYLVRQRHAGAAQQYRRPRRHLHDTGDPCRGHRRVLQHQPDLPLSRRRAAGSVLLRRAHHRHRGRRARHRPHRIAPPQHDSARADAVQDRARLHLRLRRVRSDHGQGAGRGRLGRRARAAEAGARQRQALRPRRGERDRDRRRAVPAAVRGGRGNPLRSERQRHGAARHPFARPGPRDHVPPDRPPCARPAAGTRDHQLRRHRQGAVWPRHLRLALDVDRRYRLHACGGEDHRARQADRRASAGDCPQPTSNSPTAASPSPAPTARSI